MVSVRVNCDHWLGHSLLHSALGRLGWCHLPLCWKWKEGPVEGLSHSGFLVIALFEGVDHQGLKSMIFLTQEAEL